MVALFSESSARFLVEVTPEQTMAFEEALARRPYAQIGRVTEDAMLRIQGFKSQVTVELSVEALHEAWKSGLIV